MLSDYDVSLSPEVSSQIIWPVACPLNPQQSSDI